MGRLRGKYAREDGVVTGDCGSGMPAVTIKTQNNNKARLLGRRPEVSLNKLQALFRRSRVTSAMTGDKGRLRVKYARSDKLVTRHAM